MEVKILGMVRSHSPEVYSPSDCWIVDACVNGKCFMGAIYNPVKDKLTAPTDGRKLNMKPDERREVAAAVRKLLADAKIISD